MAAFAGYQPRMDDFVRDQGVIWLPHIMRRLANRFVEACEEVFPEFGLIVPPNMVSTVHLLHERGPQAVMAIATITHQSHPLIIKYVKQLKALGLVRSAADAKDKRRTIVSLTAKGKEQARLLVKVRDWFVPAYEDLIDEADAEVFGALWRMEEALRRRSFGERIMAKSDAGANPPVAGGQT